MNLCSLWLKFSCIFKQEPSLANMNEDLKQILDLSFNILKAVEVVMETVP